VAEASSPSALSKRHIEPEPNSIARLALSVKKQVAVGSFDRLITARIPTFANDAQRYKTVTTAAQSDL
jgi:hypothetical protein